MEKLLVLDLDGSFELGFSAKLEIRDSINSFPQTCIKGQLTANPELLNAYRQWQQRYWSLEGLFRGLKDSNPDQITNGSRREDAIKACQTAADGVEQGLNDWLNHCSAFDAVRKGLLQSGAQFRLWLRTDDGWVQRFPWEKWDVLREAEVEFGLLLPEYDIAPQQHLPHRQIRILGILGYATDLKYLETEKQIINDIAGRAGAEIVWKDWQALKSPAGLNELLREGSWDILLFSGHSASTEDGKRCQIQFTQRHQLEIPDFRFALRDAAVKGLQLAIFNSCDGVGLAHQLAAEKGIVLPHLVFMREKLPDAVSPQFLKQFLTEFTRGKSLYGAVYEAQKVLHDDWEKDYPCASWLPVVCPNPRAVSPTWAGLSEGPKRRQRRLSLLKVVAAGFVAAALVVGVREAGQLQALELRAYDEVLRHKPVEKADDRLLVVTIDQADMDYQDAQGMKRAVIEGSQKKKPLRSLSGEALSMLIDKLQQGQASVIAMDVFRPISASQDYPPLAQQLRNMRNVIGICSFDPQAKIAPPELPKNQIGFAGVPYDDSTRNNDDSNQDATTPQLVRRYLYASRLSPASECLPPKVQDLEPCKVSLSFGLLITKTYLESRNTEFDCSKSSNGVFSLKVGNAEFSGRLSDFQGPYKDESLQEIKAGFQTFLNYRRVNAANGVDAITKIADTVSLAKVLSPDFRVDSVRDKIVLIGVTEPGKDDWTTPLSLRDSEKVPGVYLHAHAVSQFLDAFLDEKPVVAPMAIWQEWLWILGWVLGAGLLSWRFYGVRWFLVVNGAVLIGMMGCCVLLFNTVGVWVPLVPPMLGMLVAAGLVRGLCGRDA